MAKTLSIVVDHLERLDIPTAQWDAEDEQRIEKQKIADGINRLLQWIDEYDVKAEVTPNRSGIILVPRK